MITSSMDVSSNELSRTVSRILRHEPARYGLALDEEGWIDIDALLDALRAENARWQAMERADLVRMVAQSSKRRHEIVDNRIRALYGHSVPGRVVQAEAVPPELLFHGTSPAAWKTIAVEGLRSMGRQYVHLSNDEAVARHVGKRKSATPVLLVIHSGEAHRAGIRFWRNDVVWLAEQIPAQFVSLR